MGQMLAQMKTLDAPVSLSIKTHPSAGEMAQALRALAEILEGSSSILSRISTHWILFAILFFLLPTLGASWHLYLH